MSGEVGPLGWDGLPEGSVEPKGGVVVTGEEQHLCSMMREQHQGIGRGQLSYLQA